MPEPERTVVPNRKAQWSRTGKDCESGKITFTRAYTQGTLKSTLFLAYLEDLTLNPVLRPYGTSVQNFPSCWLLLDPPSCWLLLDLPSCWLLLDPPSCWLLLDPPSCWLLLDLPSCWLLLDLPSCWFCSILRLRLIPLSLPDPLPFPTRRYPSVRRRHPSRTLPVQEKSCFISKKI